MDIIWTFVLLSAWYAVQAGISFTTQDLKDLNGLLQRGLRWNLGRDP